MLLLPPLATRHPDWRLPVSPAAVDALIAHWLSADSVANAECLADPPLVLWGVLRSQEEPEPLASWPATLDALAALGPAPFLDATSTAADPARPQRALLLAAKSRRLAQTAAQLAEFYGAFEPDEARYYGLLWYWRDWLLWASDGEAADWIAVPAWLAALGHARCEGQPKDTAQLCAQAADLIAGRPPPQGFAIDTAEFETQRAESTPDARAATVAWWPRLAARLHRLNQLEQQFEERLEAEKLEAMAEFAAGAGHEINNPVAIISGRAQLLLREERDPERRRELATMNTQAMRVYEMISDMMLFARTPEPQFEQVALDPQIDQLLEDMQDRCGGHQVKLTRARSPGDVTLQADPAQLQVALRAMCQNAVEAIGRNGGIEVAVEPPAESADLPADRRFVQIHVRDTGPGIPPEVRRHLFDPFFSGRQAGRGLGMGLSKCWRIVEKHHGTIAVESTPGRGTQFTLRLPVAQPQPVRVESRA